MEADASAKRQLAILDQRNKQCKELTEAHNRAMGGLRPLTPFDCSSMVMQQMTSQQQHLYNALVQKQVSFELVLRSRRLVVEERLRIENEADAVSAEISSKYKQTVTEISGVSSSCFLSMLSSHLPTHNCFSHLVSTTAGGKRMQFRNNCF